MAPRSHGLRKGLKRHLALPGGGFWGCFVTSCVFKRKNASMVRDGVRQLNLQANDCVLEVGFGPGLGLEHILKEVTNGHVYGLEMSEKMVGAAKKRLRKFIKDSGRVELVQGDVADMQVFTDEMFDKILHVNCMYFWPSLSGALRELYRVLAPGGLMVASVRINLAGEGDDIFKHSESDYETALRRAGFEKIRRSQPTANSNFMHISCRKPLYEAASSSSGSATADGSSESSGPSSSAPASSSMEDASPSSDPYGYGGGSSSLDSDNDSGESSSSPNSSEAPPRLRHEYTLGKSKSKKKGKLEKRKSDKLSSKYLQNTLD